MRILLTNFLEETLEFLQQNRKSSKDVRFVTADRMRCYWYDFVKQAHLINYDPDYGHNKLNMDLKLIGADFYAERIEYDGWESWAYREIPDVSKFEDCRRLRLIDPDYHGNGIVIKGDEDGIL